MTLDAGLEIRIPKHQIVQPVLDIDDNGQQQVVNTTERAVLFFSVLPKNLRITVLGRPFMSSAYLFVDNDKEQFTLWASKPDPKQDLVAVGSPVCENRKSTFTSGKIAGIAVGAIAALALSSWIVYLLQNRWASKRQPVQNHQEDQTSDETPCLEAATPNDVPTSELPLEQNPGYGISPYEMNGASAVELAAAHSAEGIWSTNHR